ncbi:hypothetical protein FVE85_4040 [Porphyridium purpureum]|uniref:Uncharacterized protein n=1 Tax=Porphyridium purpureum TaxID=35688 RepID=A0A5J4YS47_PORPP|nr:hypothetical protein FVE85_4040 [Porphyridium purpureum]|eukprot:POR7345..scf229_5
MKRRSSRRLNEKEPVRAPVEPHKRASSEPSSSLSSSHPSRQPHPQPFSSSSGGGESLKEKPAQQTRQKRTRGKSASRPGDEFSSAYTDKARKLKAEDGEQASEAASEADKDLGLDARLKKVLEARYVGGFRMKQASSVLEETPPPHRLHGCWSHDRAEGSRAYRENGSALNACGLSCGITVHVTQEGSHGNVKVASKRKSYETVTGLITVDIRKESVRIGEQWVAAYCGGQIMSIHWSCSPGHAKDDESIHFLLVSVAPDAYRFSVIPFPCSDSANNDRQLGAGALQCWKVDSKKRTAKLYSMFPLDPDLAISCARWLPAGKARTADSGGACVVSYHGAGRVDLLWWNADQSEGTVRTLFTLDDHSDWIRCIDVTECASANAASSHEESFLMMVAGTAHGRLYSAQLCFRDDRTGTDSVVLRSVTSTPLQPGPLREVKFMACDSSWRLVNEKDGQLGTNSAVSSALTRARLPSCGCVVLVTPEVVLRNTPCLTMWNAHDLSRCLASHSPERRDFNVVHGWFTVRDKGKENRCQVTPNAVVGYRSGRLVRLSVSADADDERCEVAFREHLPQKTKGASKADDGVHFARLHPSMADVARVADGSFITTTKSGLIARVPASAVARDIIEYDTIASLEPKGQDGVEKDQLYLRLATRIETSSAGITIHDILGRENRSIITQSRFAFGRLAARSHDCRSVGSIMPHADNASSLECVAMAGDAGLMLFLFL